MFAQIIPLIRMPRRFAYFDYTIPVDMDLGIGDLVNIKFKNRMISGVVRGMSEVSEFKRLSMVESIERKHIMTAQDIARLETIAYNIIQSSSSMLLSALNGIQSISSSRAITSGNKSGALDRGTADNVREACDESIKGDAVFISSYEGAIASCKMVCARAKDQILIIVPRERDVDIFSSFISKDHAVLSGKTKASHRKWILNAWQTGELNILIGTKQASLIPAYKLDRIIIFDSHSEDHVSYNRNPRYDARLCAKLLSIQHNANILFLNFANTIENNSITSISDKSAQAKIIDLKDQNEKTNTIFVSESLNNAIANTLQNKKSVLLSYNAKGVAKSLQCKACGHIPLCGTCGAQPTVRVDDLVCGKCKTEMWIPKFCPLCGKNKLSCKGIGNKKLASDLTKLFPTAKIAIIDKEHAKIMGANIIIATERYFQSVYQPFISKFGLVAEVCADKLIGNNYRSSEIVTYKLNRLSHIAHACKSDLIVQTWSRDLIRRMMDGCKTIKEEAQVRKEYCLPPFSDEFIIYEDNSQFNEDVSKYAAIMNIDDKTIIYCDKQHREKIISILNQLPDSIKIQTNYQSYETYSAHNSK